MAQITRSYGSTSLGQIHARSIAADNEPSKPALICLHPAPSSGLYFSSTMPKLNEGRHVIAPDYPGYGGSDSLQEAPSISDYATAMLEFIDSLSFDGPVDVLGFHTGSLVAVEMALLAPNSIRRLVLCDIPYFEAEQRVALHQKMAQPMDVTADLSCLSAPWGFDVTGRIDSVPPARAFELFAEHIRAGANDYFGFGAAFSYDCEARFATLDADVAVLATQSGLRAATVVASEALSNASFTDIPEVTTAVFETGATAMAKRINEALTQ